MNRKLVFITCLLFSLLITLPPKLKIGVTEASDDYPVHNLNTSLNYTRIQEAIDAPETLGGHEISVDAGTYYEQVNVSKSIILEGENQVNTTIDGEYNDTVISVTANGAVVKGFAIRKSLITGYLVYLKNVTECEIEANSLLQSGIYNYGIFCLDCKYCNIIGNTIVHSTNGMELSNCTNCEVSNNSIWQSDQAGLLVYHSQNCTISRNSVNETIESHSINAIIAFCGNCLITDNFVSYGAYDGMQVNFSENCTISENTLSGNKEGFGMYNTSNSDVYHNNFMDPSNFVGPIIDPIGWTGPSYDYRFNRIDDGFEGNYWAVYNGSDTNSDGLGDTSYSAGPNDTDYHPLAGPFRSYDTVLDQHVNVVSNSTIEDFQYFQSNCTMRMQVSNMSQTQDYGFCRVCIPHALMNDTYKVTIEGGEPYYVNYTLYDNGTHRWIYLSYQHSTLEVIIIPQFPSFLISLLFTIAITLAIVIRRKKYRQQLSLSFCIYAFS